MGVLESETGPLPGPAAPQTKPSSLGQLPRATSAGARASGRDRRQNGCLHGFDNDPRLRYYRLMTHDPDIFKLPAAERIQLVQDLWDSIAADSDAVPVPPEHLQELQ